MRKNGNAGPLRLFRAREIVTLDGSEPEAIATLGAWVVASGSLSELRRRFNGAKVIDLGDGVVVPGFNDAHCHPSLAALEELRLSLGPENAGNVDEFREKLRRVVERTPSGEWVVAQAFNPARVPDGYSVDRRFLDAISRTHKVAVVLASVHGAIANSAALEAAGYDDESGPVAGGHLGRDDRGSLNGWLYERAWIDLWLPGPRGREWLPDPTPSSVVDALVRVNRRLHAAGVTSYCDAVVSPSEWRVYDAARRNGKLTPRVGMLLWHSYSEQLVDLGIGAGFGDERLRLVGVKLMLDGSLSGGTCLCAESYSSASGGSNGIQLLDEDELHRVVAGVHESGGRVAIHANGDRAIDLAVSAIEAARGRDPSNDVNHRIEHCSLVNGQLLRRIAESNITVLPFGGFVNYHGEALRAYYGEDRAAGACAHGSFLKAGVSVGGASDYPVGPVEPLMAIQTMVTREMSDGTVLGEGQKISPLEALGIYTAGSAAATGERRIKGTLAPGQLADFVVLGRNPLDVDPHEIASTPVLSTWVGGECVWRHAGN